MEKNQPNVNDNRLMFGWRFYCREIGYHDLNENKIKQNFNWTYFLNLKSHGSKNEKESTKYIEQKSERKKKENRWNVSSKRMLCETKIVTKLTK